MHKRAFGIVLSYANTILNAILGLFLSSFLVRILGNAEYGLYQTMASFVNNLVMLEFGVGTVMTRNISMCRKEAMSHSDLLREISTIGTITWVLSLLICLAAAIFYISVETMYCSVLTLKQINYGKNIFLILAAHLVLSFVGQTLNGYILGCEDYTFSNFLTLIRTILRTILIVCIVYRWKLSIVIALVDFAITATALVITYGYARKKHGFKYRWSMFDWKIFRSIYPICFAIFLQGIVNQANTNVDKFVIGMAIGPESVTLYSIALYIFSLFSTSTTIPISMYLPGVAKQIQSGISGKDLLVYLVQPCRLVVLVGGTILFGFFVLGQDFITLFYGQDMCQAWTIAIIIMVPMYVNMANGILVNVLDVYNKRLIRSYVLLGTTVLNIILTVWWITERGMIGAAIATAIATTLGQVVIMNYYYYRFLGIDIFFMFKETFKGIGLCLILATACSFGVVYFVKNSVIALVCGGLAFVITEVILLFLFGLNHSEKAFILGAIKKKR